MKEYLIRFFNYSDWANRKLISVIKQIADKQEAIKLFSHLITTQDKWLNRITGRADDSTLTWFGDVFDMEQLEQKWADSYNRWISLLQESDDLALGDQIYFIRAADGKKMKVKLKDIVLQLNYHGIHHRAQINRLISQQGIAPPSTDYILTVIAET